MGGVVPGLVMGLALMILVFIIALRRGYPRTRFRILALVKQFFVSILSIITPLIILSGFTLGWFTPTEASSVAVGYALFIAVVVYRSMDWKSFKKCLLESALTSANTLFIIGSSTLFSYVLIKEGISTQIAEFILGISSNPNICLLVVNVFLLILGMFMEPGAILTLMLPVLIPIAKGLGLDMVHFGVVIVLNLMIGQVTPPFGVCLFIVADVEKLELNKLYRSILPFLVPLIIVLFLITYIPGLVTWLPYSLIAK
jgi:tripartite ATP-independent transporter DctM subunit